MKDRLGYNLFVDAHVAIAVIEKGRPKLVIGTVVKIIEARTEVIVEHDNGYKTNRSPNSVVMV